MTHNSRIAMAMAIALSFGTTQHLSATEKASHSAIDAETPNSIIDLNPVVVTGNGHRQMLKSSTTPVHVISKGLIKEAGVTDFQDALSRLVPQI